MATPPVPPRPLDAYDDRSAQRHPNAPPPVPPLPPDFRIELESEFGSAPHFEDPLVAPRPHKLQPDLPAHMARTLHDQASTPFPNDYGGRSPQPNYNAGPGYGYTTNRGPSPLPPPQGADWSPWAAVGSPPGQGFQTPYGIQPYATGPQYSQPPLRQEDVTSSLAALSMSPQPRAPHQQHQPRTSAAYGPPPQIAQPSGPSQPSQQHARQYSATRPLNFSKSPSPPRQPEHTTGPSSLTAPLPTVAMLTAALPSIQQPTSDPVGKVAWCRDVLSLVIRAESVQMSASNPTNVNAADVPVGPVRIGDQQLLRLVDIAVPLILQLSSPSPMPNPMPLHIAEAIYLRGTCEASGAYPQHISQSSRSAFRDYEQAARNGFHAAWFKLGRDYENVSDIPRAKNCFERGVNHGDERCLYRMGMAHLMGQLALPASAEAALPLLYKAATLATVEVPQPAYVYALLLLAEFSHISIPPELFRRFTPEGSSPQAEARKHLERAAYLNFSPAQYKLGHAYEFATPPFPFDALLSVQYYSLASQQGEIEADMALSKWFLCGAEGAFEKDEGLAFTFAEKAARKGLPSAEFALGYYAEVGVGGPKDIETARRWYSKASEHGNEDATERLRALSQPSPQTLSRAEHENLTESKLVRTRTQAKQRSDANGARPPPMPAAQGAQIVEHARRNSLMRPPAASLAGAPARGYGTPITEEPRTQGRIPQASIPSSHSSPSSRPTDLPNAGPPSHTQSPRPFANAPRYALADPGSGSATTPRPVPTPAFGPPRQNRQSPGPSQSPARGSNNASPAPAGPPRKGAQTFAEMGITTAKVEEKECVIM